MNIDYNKDYYAALGVQKTATDDEIKSAHRKLCMKYHPDLQHDKTDEEKKKSTEKLQEINEAYEVLGDKDKRREYDNAREMGGNGFAFGDDADILRNFMKRNGFGFHDFGFSPGHCQDASDFREPSYQWPPESINGKNVNINVTLPFESFYFGCTKNFEVTVERKCPHCNRGIIGKNPKYENCKQCGGKGFVQHRKGSFILQETCMGCQGRGHRIENICSHCKGTTVCGTRVQNCEFVIPKFSPLRMYKTFTGLGHCGRFGGLDGDININITLGAQGKFTQAPANSLIYGMSTTLKCVHVVPVIKALAGCTEKVLTPHGYVDVELPPCFVDGYTKILEGKGWKWRENDDYGNLEVMFRWDIPSKITEKESSELMKLYKEMEANGDFATTAEFLKENEEYSKKLEKSVKST